MSNLAIGYIRISSDLNGQDERALERQAARIREACAARNFKLLTIHEDEGSAVSKDSLKKREGLRTALARAEQENAIIVVVSVSRLFRNLAEAKQTITTNSPRIFSLDCNDFVSQKTLFKKVARAEQEAKTISLGTKKAMERDKVSGPPASARALGNARSTKSRKLQSENHANSIADALEKNSNWSLLSRQEIIDILNRSQIKTSRGCSWTKENIRQPLERARAILQEREDLEKDDDLFEPFVFPPKTPSPVEIAQLPETELTPAEEDELLHALPNFGMF